MEKTAECSPEQLSDLKSAYEDFKKEAKKRKSAVKNRQASILEFNDWIIQQLDIQMLHH